MTGPSYMSRWGSPLPPYLLEGVPDPLFNMKFFKLTIGEKAKNFLRVLCALLRCVPQTPLSFGGCPDPLPSWSRKPPQKPWLLNTMAFKESLVC